MPDISFPSNPSPNDTYTFGGKTWIWTGSYWALNSAGSINGIPIGNVTPSTGAFTTLASTGNTTAGNLLTGGAISATGNVTASYYFGNGSLLTGIITSVANINNGTSNVTVVSSGGNITVGVGGTGNIAVFSTDGLDVTGRLSATGTVTGGNLVTAGAASAAGNVTGGNVLTGGAVSAAGNVTGNYFLGNGSQLTGIVATATEIINGTSNVSINAANANVTITVAGETDSSVFSPGSLFTGILAVPKTLTGNVVMAANSFGTIISGTVITGNLQIPDGTTVYTWTPS